jgi:hypothetical protein
MFDEDPEYFLIVFGLYLEDSFACGEQDIRNDGSFSLPPPSPATALLQAIKWRASPARARSAGTSLLLVEASILRGYKVQPFCTLLV